MAAQSRILAASVVALLAAAGQAFGMSREPDCLDVLSVDTRRWADCTAEFGRHDSRCKTLTGRMSATMQRCEAKGYAKARIDAAMTRGYRSAGNPDTLRPLPDTTPRPQPKAAPGPIPRIERTPAAGD